MDFIAVGELVIKVNMTEELVAVISCDRSPRQCLVISLKCTTDNQLHLVSCQVLFIQINGRAHRQMQNKC